MFILHLHTGKVKVRRFGFLVGELGQLTCCKPTKPECFVWIVIDLKTGDNAVRKCQCGHDESS